jgi:hypothetical protein
MVPISVICMRFLIRYQSSAGFCLSGKISHLWMMQPPNLRPAELNPFGFMLRYCHVCDHVRYKNRGEPVCGKYVKEVTLYQVCDDFQDGGKADRLRNKPTNLEWKGSY